MDFDKVRDEKIITFVQQAASGEVVLVLVRDLREACFLKGFIIDFLSNAGVDFKLMTGWSITFPSRRGCILFRALDHGASERIFGFKFTRLVEYNLWGLTTQQTQARAVIRELHRYNLNKAKLTGEVVEL